MSLKDLLFAKAAGGGGNPNRVQTIEGTLEDMWGDIDVSGFEEALTNGNASATVYLDTSALGLGSGTLPLYVDTNDHYFFASSCRGTTSSLTFASCINWGNPAGSLLFATAYSSDGSGTDMIPYASLIPTTLTIIWHPLPDQS